MSSINLFPVLPVTAGFGTKLSAKDSTKSTGMQDESLHYGIIQGWTKPVRSAGLLLYAIPGSLPVAIYWCPGQASALCGSSPVL